MLKSLIASKIRRLLLKTFFADVEAEYYVRQLASLNKISAGTAHRELKKLSSSGILRVRPVGNIRLYSLDRENPIYEEMKNLINKTEGAIKLVSDAIAGIRGVRVAFIYGSLAKGEERSDSDIDIFLIGDGIDEDELVVRLGSLEKKMSKEINFTRYTESEYKKEKKNKNSFLLEVVAGKKVFIKGGENEL